MALSLCSQPGLAAKASLQSRNAPPPARPSAAPSQLRRTPGASRGPSRLQAGKDFDSVLADVADKFEKSNNKPAVIGWSAAGIAAFFVSEWLIHLPGLDFLLGFPVQLVGLLSIPVIVQRYVVDKKDWQGELGGVVTDVSKQLPGL